MQHSMSKDIAFNGETTPRHTFLCSNSRCLLPGDPRFLCAKHWKIIHSSLEARGEGVLPHMAYTGMCRWTGYGFRPVCPKQSI